MPRPRPNRTEASAGTPSSTWSCFDNRRHRVLATENGCAGHIHAQPQVESACWRGQPVGLMTCRSGVLQVDVDGTVGILREAGPIADAVPIDGIRHEAFFRVSHCQRPERVVGRRTPRRKVQDVVVLSGERVTRAVNTRPSSTTTFRPNVSADEMLRYMDRKHHETSLVTTPDGRLVGLVRREDLEGALRRGA